MTVNPITCGHISVETKMIGITEQQTYFTIPTVLRLYQFLPCLQDAVTVLFLLSERD